MILSVENPMVEANQIIRELRRGRAVDDARIERVLEQLLDDISDQGDRIQELREFYAI